MAREKGRSFSFDIGTSPSWVRSSSFYSTVPGVSLFLGSCHKVILIIRIEKQFLKHLLCVSHCAKCFIWTHMVLRKPSGVYRPLLMHVKDGETEAEGEGEREREI